MKTGVWLHGDSLSKRDPALRNHPEARSVFVFDRPFLEKAGLSFKRIFFLYECAVEAADCLVALVTYGTSMSILYSACGFTFGASCVGALIAHPIIGGAVAVYCGRALSTCGITR